MAPSLRLLGVVGLVLVAPGTARAGAPTDTLRDFFARANAIIQRPDEQMTVEERIVRIRQMANAVFDLRRAAADALGPEWAARTPAEQAQFAEVFGDALQRAYLSLVGLKAKVSGGVGVVFVDEVVSVDTAVVRTTLATRANGTLAVDYRMTRAGDTWTVIDALIDGSSLVGTYRAQFSRVLQSYTYAELLEMMRAVAPESPRPAVAMASEAVKPGDDVRVVPAIQTSPPPSVPSTPTRPSEPRATEPPTGAPIPSAGAAPSSTAAPAEGITDPAAPQVASVTGPAPAPATVPASPPSSAVLAPPAPPPTPASPPSPAPPARRFWVELGAFGSPELAAKVLAGLTDPAIAIFTPPAGRSRESLTRVLVGPFSERDGAAAKARQLEAAGYRGVVAEE